MVSEKQKKIDAAKKVKEAATAPAAPAVTAPAAPAVTAPVEASPTLKKQIADLFTQDKDKEINTFQVIEAIRFKQPKIKEGYIRLLLTQLKNEGLIGEVRREGRVSVLRASAGGSGQAILPKARKGKGVLKDDAEILQQALAMVHGVIVRQQALMKEIQRFKAALK